MNQKQKMKIWKFGAGHDMPGVWENLPAWCIIREPSEPFQNKLCENCKETSRITIPGAKPSDHPNRTIRKSFCFTSGRKEDAG